MKIGTAISQTKIEQCANYKKQTVKYATEELIAKLIKNHPNAIEAITNLIQSFQIGKQIVSPNNRHMFLEEITAIVTQKLLFDLTKAYLNKLQITTLIVHLILLSLNHYGEVLSMNHEANSDNNYDYLKNLMKDDDSGFIKNTVDLVKKIIPSTSKQLFCINNSNVTRHQYDNSTFDNRIKTEKERFAIKQQIIQRHNILILINGETISAQEQMKEIRSKLVSRLHLDKANNKLESLFYAIKNHVQAHHEFNISKSRAEYTDPLNKMFLMNKILLKVNEILKIENTLIPFPMWTATEYDIVANISEIQRDELLAVYKYYKENILINNPATVEVAINEIMSIHKQTRGYLYTEGARDEDDAGINVINRVHVQGFIIDEHDDVLSIVRYEPLVTLLDKKKVYYNNLSWCFTNDPTFIQTDTFSCGMLAMFAQKELLKHHSKQLKELTLKLIVKMECNTIRRIVVLSPYILLCAQSFSYVETWRILLSPPASNDNHTSNMQNRPNKTLYSWINNIKRVDEDGNEIDLTLVFLDEFSKKWLNEFYIVKARIDYMSITHITDASSFSTKQTKINPSLAYQTNKYKST